MYLINDERLLRTKIVATIGPERGRIFDPSNNERKDTIKYNTLLPWFIEAGVDVLRLNMAFFNPNDEPKKTNQYKVLKWLNKNNNQKAKNVALLGDLPGPKIRLRINKDGPIKVNEGNIFCLDFAEKTPRSLEGTSGSASVLAYDRPFQEEVNKIVSADTRVRSCYNIDEYIKYATEQGIKVFFSIADGKVILEPLKPTADQNKMKGLVKCKVAKEGEIENKKGLSIRKTKIDIDSFQEPDQKALEFLLEHGSDVLTFIGVSFVKIKKDILTVRKHMEEYLQEKKGISRKNARIRSPSVIAKIETLDALDNIDSILDASDGIMVARGDLGLQLDPEEVPKKHKEIVRKCNLRGKPVITATQMLLSMTDNYEPTRAEVTDVFNAILDGTDAIMLSEETSEGKYPVRSIEMMVKIADQAEHYFERRGMEVESRRRITMSRFRVRLEGSDSLIDENTDRLRNGIDEALIEGDNWQRELYQEKLKKSQNQRITDRISHSACVLSEGGNIKAIISPTTSGRSARMISRFRPSVRIIGPAHDVCNARKLLLSYGVYPLFIGAEQKTPDEVFEDSIEKALEEGFFYWRPEFKILKSKDEVIFTAGTPLHTPGTTNLIQIKKI